MKTKWNRWSILCWGMVIERETQTRPTEGWGGEREPAAPRWGGSAITGFPDGIYWGRTKLNVGRRWQTYLWEKCSCQRRRRGQRALLHWQLRYRTHNLHKPCSCDRNSYTNPCLTRWVYHVCQRKGLGSLQQGSWDWSRLGGPRSHTLTKEEGQPWENHSDHHLSLFPG